MEKLAEQEIREIVAAREWVIRDVDAGGVLVEKVPEGGTELFERDLLPADVTVGDRFRVVAQLDRRSDAPDPGHPAADDGALPDAAREALRNLT